MPDSQDPNRAYLEKLHGLLGVALRAIVREHWQDASIKELWMMGIERSKFVVARDATRGRDRVLKGIDALDFQKIKPEHFFQWFDETVGWPNDLKALTTNAYGAATKIVLHRGNRGAILEAKETLRQARDGIGDILGISADVSEPAGASGSNESQALAVLLEHPNWTDTRIAKEIGVSRTTIYRFPRFKAARQAQISGQLPTDPQRTRNPKKSARLATDRYRREQDE